MENYNSEPSAPDFACNGLAAGNYTSVSVLQSGDTEQLRQFGVSELQVERLEVALLTAQATILRKLPPMAAVRKELQHLWRTVQLAYEAVERLGETSSFAQAEAVSRLGQSEAGRLGAKRSRVIGPEVDEEATARLLLSSFIEASRPIVRATRIALRDLPREQRRARADPKFAALIDEALNSQQSSQLSRSKERNRTKGRQFRPSISCSSPFYNVVAICYRAATGTDHEPERLIRAYLRQLKPEPRLTLRARRKA